MLFDELFENRNTVAVRLKDCIRNAGHTKLSFSAKSGISRPTLDRLLKGDIDNKTSFDKHLRKILQVLSLSPEELMSYRHSTEQHTEIMYSKNPPEQHEMNDTAKKQYDTLLDIIELCAIYY